MPSSDFQTSTQIQTLFNRIAPAYDQLNQVMSLGLHQIWKGMTVRWARPPKGGQVLDICCGTGDLALQLALQVGSQGRVYGLDFASEMLDIAEARAKSLRPDYQFTWQQGDALQLPFPDQHFDSVTMGYGLRNVTDIPQAFREIWRVLRPGGWAAILDFHRPNNTQAQAFQKFYLSQVVVPMATRLGLENEYAYILPSVETFPNSDEQLRLAANAGFSERYFYPLVFGHMGVLAVQKS